MYSKDGAIVDRREMLKVKAKSLAAEARIIRKEESKTHGPLREELHAHRVKELRQEARYTHLAYGLIKGRTIQQMEGVATLRCSNKRIVAMIEKYGPQGEAKGALLTVCNEIGVGQVPPYGRL